jgi:predicted RNA-binding protein Jag
MSEGPISRPPRAPRPKGRMRPGNQRDGRPEARGGPIAPPIPPEELIPRLKIFLDLVVREMSLSLTYDISKATDSESDETEPYPQHDGPPQAEKRNIHQEQDSTGLLVRFSGEDEELLLAHNGELLLALEYLAHRWLHLPPAQHEGVRFECGDFRATHLDELKLSARVAAQRVRETGQPFPFNPMSSRDRRTIHLELNGAPGVRTISEGSGDRRHLVIYPATKK